MNVRILDMKARTFAELKKTNGGWTGRMRRARPKAPRAERRRELMVGVRSFP
jgi:hypothetical protein